MPATPSQIKDALKVALETIPGLRAYDYQPDQVNPPFAFATLEEITYHGAMGSGNVVNQFTVTVVVQRSSERAAQDKLDGFVAYDGAQSVRRAIEADRTLGGIVQDLICTSARNIQNFDANETTYLSVDFQVTVYA
jgi:hypothetical protein